MPVVFSNPQFKNQSGASPYNQSFSTQLNYRSMIGEVLQWNPNLDPNAAGRFLNNHYRRIIRMRDWYGLKVRGQITVPNVVSNGTATFTNGSTSVAGVGTTWTSALVGLQIRSGFTFPYATITAVNQGTQVITMDIPFGGMTATGGYQIVMAYVTLGANVKRLLWAVNQLQGWPMDVNVPVQVINEWDVWRQSLGWSKVMATRPPTPDGQFQVEIWPTPYANQVFPFEAYTQPPDMSADTDAPVAWINSDVLVSRAIADALTFGGPKKNEYYDPNTAAAKIAEFNEAVMQMIYADEGMDQQDVSWDYGHEEGRWGAGQGSAFGQSHDM